MKLARLAGCLVALALGAVAVGAPTPSSPAAVEIDAPALNVRDGPGAGYPVVAQARRGEVYAAVGQSGAWLRIWWGGATAWVHGGYTRASAAPVKVVSAARLNVRSGPGTQYAVLAQAAQGEMRAVVASQGDWRRVYYAGQPGWVHGAYLADPPGSAPPPPAGFQVVDARALSPHRVAVRFSTAVEAATVDAGAFLVPGVPISAAAPDGADAAVVNLETGEQPGGGATCVLVASAVLRGTGGAALGRNTATFAGGGLAPAAFETLGAGTSLADLAARGWDVEDDPAATSGGPSAWTVDGGTILQASNIYGGSSSLDARRDPAKPGTALVLRGAPADVFVEATLTTPDDDGIGLVLRHRDARTFYRFDWMRQGERRQIVKVVNGVATRLAFDREAYNSGRAYRLRFQARGARLSAFVDDALVLSADDADLGAGAAGLFSWGSEGARFDDVRVQPLAPRAATAAGAPWPFAADARQRESAPRITHGTAAGDPLSDRVRLWTRTSAAASVAFEVSERPDLSAPLRTAPLATGAAGDFTAQVEIDGLRPATRYHYRAIAADPARPGERNGSAAGTFSTAPDRGAASDVAFAFGADISQEYRSQFGVFEKIRAQDPAFFLSLGDLPYTDSGGVARTAAEYREKHQEVRDRALARFLGSVPLVATWDDHEIGNDWDPGMDPSRIANGTAAWRLYMPARPDPAATAAGQIFRSIRVGRDVEVFVLDTRSRRSRSSAPDGPAKTMLGAAQRAWLEAGLLGSTARWKLIATSVPLRYGTTGDDDWEGYTTERRALFDFIRGHGIGGVAFLAGDQHWAAVHHHPEGFVEVQACPTAAFLRDPPAARDPHVVFLEKTQSFGIVRARVAGPDPRLEIEVRDGAGALLWTEVVR